MSMTSGPAEPFITLNSCVLPSNSSVAPGSPTLCPIFAAAIVAMANPFHLTLGNRVNGGSGNSIFRKLRLVLDHFPSGAKRTEHRQCCTATGRKQYEIQ